MTDYYNEDAIAPLQQRGAMGYMYRDIVSFMPIVDCIKAVFEGRRYAVGAQSY